MRRRSGTQPYGPAEVACRRASECSPAEGCRSLLHPVFSPEVTAQAAPAAARRTWRAVGRSSQPGEWNRSGGDVVSLALGGQGEASSAPR